MKKLDLTEVSKYVEKNIGVFHKKRIDSLDTLKLKKVLKRKNPYLFKAKNSLKFSVLPLNKFINKIISYHFKFEFDALSEPESL